MSHKSLSKKRAEKNVYTNHILHFVNNDCVVVCMFYFRIDLEFELPELPTKLLARQTN